MYGIYIGNCKDAEKISSQKAVTYVDIKKVDIEDKPITRINLKNNLNCKDKYRRYHKLQKTIRLQNKLHRNFQTLLHSVIEL